MSLFQHKLHQRLSTNNILRKSTGPVWSFFYFHHEISQDCEVSQHQHAAEFFDFFQNLHITQRGHL